MDLYFNRIEDVLRETIVKEKEAYIQKLQSQLVDQSAIVRQIDQIE